MAVNLTGLDVSGAALGSAKKASTPQAGTTSTQGGDSSSPQKDVSITSTASLLSGLEQSLSKVPAVDQKRVEAISAAIAAGTYRVDPNKIASGLIQSERLLGDLPTKEI
ncbi:MAG TPA: flagellar biosynthesis anti-sigma factor FlgM [Acidobacteriaceae bacterium]|nr:flagellar biosynthesis anti-sigma factor FlgM [Acidobacteriaceae bacterium]